MISAKHRLSALTASLLVSAVSLVATTTSADAASLVNSLIIPGETTDLSSGSGANQNRFGFFSDLYYDRHENVYYGLGDRGPGGGVIEYNTRVQKFSLTVNPNTGAISDFTLLETILFETADGNNFNGFSPTINGPLGLSFDPEGFAVAPNGNFYVSDEYGPSIYEFSANGKFVRALTIPENLKPKDSNGNVNYSTADEGEVVTGRVKNRGFEGMTLSPDGKQLYALLQDPLTEEGQSPSGQANGRFSRNLRLIEFDTTTGASTAQYIYQLESLDSINERIPGTTDDFNPNAQGRNIGISAIVALNNEEFLVLERDNRGFGVEDPTATGRPTGTKRVYKINLAEATDVSSISLTGINELPPAVKPVQKSVEPFFDFAAALQAAGQVIPEKLEGLTIGPQLADGSYGILLGTDNDFSITQTGSGTQFDVCTDGTQVTIDSGCPGTSTLIPGFLYSFKASATELAGYVPPQKQPEQVPEPTSTAGLLLFGLSSLWLKCWKTH